MDHVALASGDGISLAVLIHTTRKLLRTDFERCEPGILWGLSNLTFTLLFPDSSTTSAPYGTKLSEDVGPGPHPY